VASLVERHAQVAACVRDEAGTCDAPGFVLDVDVAERPEDAHRRARRCAQPHHVVEGLLLLE
jgi:hypothetical protein